MTKRIARRKPELLTETDYVALLDAQGGTCAICERPPKTRRLSVDHDHATGRVRGLLCFRCNRSLPTYIDEAWLRSATAYLASHRAKDHNARDDAA